MRQGDEQAIKKAKLGASFVISAFVAPFSVSMSYPLQRMTIALQKTFKLNFYSMALEKHKHAKYPFAEWLYAGVYKATKNAPLSKLTFAGSYFFVRDMLQGTQHENKTAVIGGVFSAVLQFFAQYPARMGQLDGIENLKIEMVKEDRFFYLRKPILSRAAPPFFAYMLCANVSAIYAYDKTKAKLSAIRPDWSLLQQSLAASVAAAFISQLASGGPDTIATRVMSKAISKKPSPELKYLKKLTTRLFLRSLAIPASIIISRGLWKSVENSIQFSGTEILKTKSHGHVSNLLLFTQNIGSVFNHVNASEMVEDLEKFEF